ncbi:MAG TPA: hypothetical protein DCY07_06945 [Rhodospirillaceae bacterium]|nr:hypothetical protein [Rhodospirillaceae bacterium]
MKTSHIIALVPVLVLGLSACALGPDYVSSNYYQDYTCNQITLEKQRVAAKLEEATQAESTERLFDTAASLFGMTPESRYSRDRDSDEAERLRNQYDVLERTAIQKDCPANASSLPQTRGRF